MNRRPFVLLLLVLLALGALLNAPWLSQSPPAKFVREAGLSIFSPAIAAAGALFDAPRAAMKNIAGLRNAQKHNDLLRERLSRLTSKSLSYDELLKENETFRRMLQFRSANPYKRTMIAARVAGRSGSQWFNTVIVDKGSADGVKKDLAVISIDGLVGKTTEVSRHYSKVTLISDPDSSVSSYLSPSGAMGVAAGTFSDILELKYVTGTASVEVNGKVITSGVSDIFPKGIPVGTVIKADKQDFALFQHILVRIAADLSRLDGVFILR
ncbi:MAG: rod shape-determining protein MreC [Candidatus Margulisiibacteriota bacterium]